MDLGRSVAIAFYFEPRDICMYVRICVSSNYIQHASSSHCYFSMNDQLQSSTVTRWRMRLDADSVHEDTDKPGPVSILWKKVLTSKTA